MKKALSLALASFFLCTNVLAANHLTHVQSYVLVNINAYRQEHGLPALVINSELSKIAAGHSEAMANHVVPMGHAGFKDRMQMIARSMHTYGMAENVAYTSGGLRNIIIGWIHSKGHRENILGNYSQTGIASSIDNRGAVYITQIFVH